MTANDVMLVQKDIARDRETSWPRMAPKRHEVFYVAGQVLKNLRPTSDDLTFGIVDGDKDCGIDAAYVYVNSMCIRRDEARQLGKQRGAKLELVLVQVKNSPGFEAKLIDKLLTHMPRLLQFDRDERALAKHANSRLIEITRRFLDIYLELPDSTPEIRVVLAALKADHRHPDFVRRCDEISDCLRDRFGTCEPKVEIIDAAGLLKLAQQRPEATKKLRLDGSPVTAGESAYLGVVRLADYRRFLTGDNGELDAALFDANVRDYEGDTDVNQSIQQTLATADTVVDFWWLNNGVTIVAAKVNRGGDTLLDLVSPQIVNGLQTSTAIHRWGALADPSDNRRLLVKVLVATEEAVRERIVRATNSQNPLGPSALRATDAIQRNIENYLGGRGLYYERRRRFYQNQNQPGDQIVSMEQMGQALLSVVCFPHIARADPDAAFGDFYYQKIFMSDHPMPFFGASIELLRASKRYLENNRPGVEPENFAYHLTMLAAMMLSRKPQPRAVDIANLEGRTAEFEAEADTLFLMIQDAFEKSKNDKTGKFRLQDKVAKDPTVTMRILTRGKQQLDYVTIGVVPEDQSPGAGQRGSARARGRRRR